MKRKAPPVTPVYETPARAEIVVRRTKNVSVVLNFSRERFMSQGGQCLPADLVDFAVAVKANLDDDAQIQLGTSGLSAYRSEVLA